VTTSAGFRHVVMFKWSQSASAAAVAGALQALNEFAVAVADLGTVSVGPDAGLSDGNFDVVVIADFADKDTYLAYAEDPRHIALLTDHIRPNLEQRVAVQYERPAG